MNVVKGGRRTGTSVASEDKSRPGVAFTLDEVNRPRRLRKGEGTLCLPP